MIEQHEEEPAIADLNPLDRRRCYRLVANRLFADALAGRELPAADARVDFSVRREVSRARRRGPFGDLCLRAVGVEQRLRLAGATALPTLMGR